MTPYSLQIFALPFYLAWFDTRVRYARSVLGPFWISIQSAVFVVAVGTLMANVFGTSIGTYMAYFSVSYIMWVFLSGVVMESTATFQSAASFIKDRGKRPELFVLVPFARQLIYLAHTIIVPVIVFAIFGKGSLSGFLLAIPGFLLFLLAALFLTAPISVLCTRFRDGRPIIESSMNLLFLMSPILWPPAAVAAKARFVLEINPIVHLIAAWREPLLNGHIAWYSLGYAALIDLVLFAMFVLSLRAVRRIPLWI